MNTFQIITHSETILGSRDLNISLDYSFSPQKASKDVVIFYHGFKGFKDWGHFNLIAQTFAQNDFLFVKYNGSYNGVTEDNLLELTEPEVFGRNTFSIELDDLGLVIDWVLRKEFSFEIRNIYLLGHSRGGGIVLLKSAEDKRVKRVCTWASVYEYGKIWGEDLLAEWKKKGVHYVVNSRTGQELPIYFDVYDDYSENYNRLHLPSLLPSIEQDALVIHGNEDAVVPLLAAEKIVEKLPNGKLLAIDGGDHVFGARHPWEEDNLPTPSDKVVEETMIFFK